MKANKHLHILKSFNYIFYIITAIIIGVIVFGGYKIYVLSQKLDSANATIVTNNQKINELENNKQELGDNLVDTENRLADLGNKNADLGNELNGKTKQNDNLSSKVDTLTKLTTIDPELLKKYSKVFFLNENYVPAELGDIPTKYLLKEDKPLEFLQPAMHYLTDLLADANKSGIPLDVVSAYRSFGTQSALKSNYVFTYGAGTANQFSADQGYSEHQLGTTVDFTTPKVGGAYPAFEQDPAYKWLLNNAYKYGFILSYPKNNTYYEYEPWHWRFVGVDLATYLHGNNMNFYDVNQRDIDSYLIKLFD